MSTHCHEFSFGVLYGTRGTPMGIIVATDRVPLPFDRDCARTASRSDATVFVSPTGAALRPRKDAISRGGDDVGALAGARVGVASLRERTPTGATDDAARRWRTPWRLPSIYRSDPPPNDGRSLFLFPRENPNPRECARDDARRRGDAPLRSRGSRGSRCLPREIARVRAETTRGSL